MAGKTIGIVGSRRRAEDSDYEKTERAFFQIYDEGDTIVSGGCPKGGDRFAEIIAEKYEIPIVIYQAEWDDLTQPDARIKENWRGKYDANAGFRRNTFIARDADVLIAVVASDRKGGTEDTIRKYRKMGKDDVVFV